MSQLEKGEKAATEQESKDFGRGLTPTLNASEPKSIAPENDFEVAVPPE